MAAFHIILGAPKTEKIKPFIKDHGIVIGVDRGAVLALEEGIQVDVALGDFDSISEEEMTTIKNRVQKVIDHPSDKDDTDTELALLYALEHTEEESINIYNWYGGRIDHLYSILLLSLQDRFQSLIERLYLVSAKNNISYYLPGEHIVQKIENMDYLSYVLLTEVKALTLKDVKYELNEESFNRPVALISNEFIGEEASFSFEEGIVAVIQSND